MNDAIGQVLSFAVVVAISPVPIIAIVLVLATPRAHSNGVAFLLGWIAGLAVLGTIVLLVAGGVGASDGGEPATWASVLKLVLGALLVLGAVRQWRDRPRGDAEPELPGWMQAVDQLHPPKAAGLGVLLSAVNPKNLLLTVAAATAIAQTGVSGADQAVALAVFVVIGSLGVAIPVIAYFVMGSRSEDLLDGMRSWMAAHNAAIMAVLLLVIGAKLLGDGLSGL